MPKIIPKTKHESRDKFWDVYYWSDMERGFGYGRNAGYQRAKTKEDAINQHLAKNKGTVRFEISAKEIQYDELMVTYQKMYDEVNWFEYILSTGGKDGK